MTENENDGLINMLVNDNLVFLYNTDRVKEKLLLAQYCGYIM